MMMKGPIMMVMMEMMEMSLILAITLAATVEEEEGAGGEGAEGDVVAGRGRGGRGLVGEVPVAAVEVAWMEAITVVGHWPPMDSTTQAPFPMGLVQATWMTGATVRVKNSLQGQIKQVRVENSGDLEGLGSAEMC